MAGHSKWANIKHRKDRADQKKGKIFSRCAKEIISAVRMGGADPKSNNRLRLAVQKAREANVPNDVIDRNVKKASSVDQADFVEMTYELYGHGGIGALVDVMTDNKNRIASDMRTIIGKKGGAIASPGAVAFNFERKGVITVPKGSIDEDSLFLAAGEAGATDLESDEEGFLVFTEPTDLYAVKENLVSGGIKCTEAYLEMIPKSYVEVDEDTYKLNQELLERVEELDDVDEVYHNMVLRAP